MNIIYGILNTAYYTRVFDKIAGSDCTKIGRQWTKYARKIFKQEGYKLVYTDTDSVYILDPFKDKERMLKVKNKIIDYIKSTVPYPQDTFDMGIDDEITHMFFFKGGSKKETTDEDPDEDDFINKGKGFMKKNYCYIKKVLDNNGNDTGKRELILKNLGVRKKSNSLVSRKLFWDIMVPKIIETGEVKFKRAFVENEIQKLLEKDIKLASMRKSVGPTSDYKKSPNGLHMQISQKYGPGIHFLIPNTKGIGVGKGKRYCTLEEFKLHKMNIDNIDLSNVWKELNYFIKPVKVKTLADFGL
jgi:DNA polymerase elongation subunit (family B)